MPKFCRRKCAAYSVNTGTEFRHLNSRITLKLFSEEAQTVSLSSLFHMLTTLSLLIVKSKCWKQANTR